MIHAVNTQAKGPWLEKEGGRIMTEATLLYLVKGSGHFQDDATPRTAVTAGHLFYLRPGVWHSYDPLPRTTWTEYWVTYDDETIKERFGDLFPGPRTLHRIGHDAEILSAFESLRDAWFARPTDTDIHLAFQLHRILFAAWRKIRGTKTDPREGLVTRIKARLAERITDEEVDWDVLCASEGVPYERMRRLFRLETGVAPGAWLLDRKQNLAREYLLHTDAEITRIGELCGFHDPNYFARFFRQREGVSPREYRRRHAPLSGS